MQASASAKGTIVQGEYVLLESIGRGACEVYRAHHMASGRLCAVRLFRGDAAAGERIVSIAQIASRVRHPALAALEAYGQLPDGSWFLISEYVQGEPLDAWADKVGIPPLPAVVDLVHRLCVGLNAAHRNGLAHDALHPHNVRVRLHDAGPGAKLEGRLLDLGVPSFMHPWPPRMKAAQFMAPEQLVRALSGDDPLRAHADPRMNVYSCGCILYSLCTGGLPFPARNLHDLAQSHAAGKLAPPSKINPQIPLTLEAIITRALEPAPAERYSSVSDLAVALARVQLVRTGSGVRPVVQPNVPAAAGGDKRATWDHGFEERPTSESRLPALLSASEGSSRSTPPPPAERQSAPVGSFSSAPPAAATEVPTVPPPRTPGAPPALPTGLIPRIPPLPPPPRAPRLSPQPISALLDAAAPAARVDSAPPPRASEPSAPLSDLPRPAASRLPLLVRRFGLRAAGVIVLGLLGVMAIASWVARAPLPVEQVRTTPLSADDHVPVRASGAAASPQPRAIAPSPVQPVPVAAEPSAAAPPAPFAVQAAPSRPAAGELAAPRPARGRGGAGRMQPRVAIYGAASARTAAQSTESSLQLAPEAVTQDSAEPDAAAEHTANEPEETPSETVAPAGESPARAAKPEVHDAAVSTRTGAAVAATRTAAEPAEAAARNRPLRASLAIRDLTVRGSLATSEVRRAIDRIRAQLDACYARAAKAAGRNGFGELRVEVEIDERGRARAPRARGGALPGLDACVAQAAGKIVSGRPPDTGTVKALWNVTFAP